MIQKPIFTALILFSLLLCVHLTNLKAQLATNKEKLSTDKKFFLQGMKFHILPSDHSVTIASAESKAIYEHAEGQISNAVQWNGNGFSFGIYKNPESHLNFIKLSNGNYLINHGGNKYLSRSNLTDHKEVYNPNPNEVNDTSKQIMIEKGSDGCSYLRSFLFKEQYLNVGGSGIYWGDGKTCFFIADQIDKCSIAAKPNKRGTVLGQSSCSQISIGSSDNEPANCSGTIKLTGQDVFNAMLAHNVSKAKCNCDVTFIRPLAGDKVSDGPLSPGGEFWNNYQKVTDEVRFTCSML